MPNITDGPTKTSEIEITPEMIEAGAKALMDGSGLIDLGPTFAEIYAREVLRAALSVRASTVCNLQNGATA